MAFPRHARRSGPSPTSRVILVLVTLAVLTYVYFMKKVSDKYHVEVGAENLRQEKRSVRATKFATELASYVGSSSKGQQLTGDEVKELRREVATRIHDVFEKPGDINAPRRVLDLSAMALTKLPDDMSILEEAYEGHGVTDFLLSDNALRSLPNSIGSMARVEKLYLRGNRLVSLPDNLGDLKVLEKLDARKNQLTAVPDSLAECISLRYLDLSNNRLTALPDSFNNLIHIEVLNLRGNGLDGSHTHALTTMVNLHKLILTDNTLGYLSEEFSALKNLEVLNLENTGLVILPEFIGSLKKLRDLNVSYNKLRELPRSFSDLHSLQDLTLRNNEFPVLPPILNEMTQIKSLVLRDNPMCVNGRRYCPFPPHLRDSSESADSQENSEGPPSGTTAAGQSGSQLLNEIRERPVSPAFRAVVEAAQAAREAPTTVGGGINGFV